MKFESVQNRRIINEFSPIIYGILSRCQIPTSHLYYDDYLQELSLKLLSLANQFDGDIFGQDRYQFVAYCQKGLYWYALDLIKKYSSQDSYSISEIPLADVPITTIPFESEMSITQFLCQSEKLLSPLEYQIFLSLASDLFTLEEIAEKLGMSRTMLYKHRQKIREKVAPLKNILM